MTGSYLLVMGSAWIECSTTNANGRHLAYSLMRDGMNYLVNHMDLVIFTLVMHKGIKVQ